MPSKAHLLAAMIDAAHGPPPFPPDRRRGWRVEVESWVTTLWRVCKLHPWLVKTPTTTAPIGPNALARTEALLPLAGGRSCQAVVGARGWPVVRGRIGFVAFVEVLGGAGRPR